MANSEVEELVRAIKATGTHNVSSIGAHHKVIDSAGNTVYVLPKTPSDRRWRDNAVRGLVKAGVLEKDPKKMNGQPKEKKKSRLADPDVQAMKVAAVKERARLLREQTNAIRDRITPLVTQVGGWGMGKGHVGATELGRAARHWGLKMNHPDVPKSDDGAGSSAQVNMKNPGGASEAGIRFWDAFVTAWESAEDQRRWYFDLVREMKGLAPTNVIVAGKTVSEKTEEKKNLRRAGRVKTYKMEERHPLEPTPIVGQLALRAVMLMAAGRELSSKIDRDEILDIGEQIAALEAQQEEDDE